MSIIYRVVDIQDKNTGKSPDLHAYIRISGPDSIEQFKQLVNRAMNTWDRAPAELKEFADMVTVGKILQPYHDQK